MDEELLASECLAVPGKEDVVVVGLSGGRDSVALLHLLHGAGLQLVACHVHHGIRGVEADEDACFCRRMAVSLGIPFVGKRGDVPRYAAQLGISLEAAAREVRYKYLSECALEYETPYVALGHHMQDQAETVLFRFCRGSGSHLGMQLVALRRNGLVVLRPLLLTSRDRLTSYLEEKGVPWREDCSNYVPDMARNRLRLEALPLLTDIMGRDVAPVMNRSARLAAETVVALEEAMRHLELEDPQGRLFLPKVGGYSQALKKSIVYHYLRKQGVPEVSEKMVCAILELMEPDGPARISLPGGKAIRRRQQRLFVE